MASAAEKQKLVWDTFRDLHQETFGGKPITKQDWDNLYTMVEVKLVTGGEITSRVLKRDSHYAKYRILCGLSEEQIKNAGNGHWVARNWQEAVERSEESGRSVHQEYDDFCVEEKQRVDGVLKAHKDFQKIQEARKSGSWVELSNGVVGTYFKVPMPENFGVGLDEEWRQAVLREFRTLFEYDKVRERLKGDMPSTKTLRSMLSALGLYDAYEVQYEKSQPSDDDNEV